MPVSLDTLSAAQIAAGIGAGEFSATDVARAALSAIDVRNAEVRASLQVTPELALDAAARVDALRTAGEPLLPLAGAPPRHQGQHEPGEYAHHLRSRMLEGYESPYTAACVQRMVDAGCLPLGKVNMDEFAFGSSTESSAFQRMNSLWDLERVPGGSLGGFAAHVDDDISGLCVGVIPAFMEAEGLATEARAAVEGALRALEAQGAEPVKVELPRLECAIAACYVIGPAEVFSNLSRFDGVRYGYQEPSCASLAEQGAKSRAHGSDAEARRRQMLGAYLLSSGVCDKYYCAAQKVRSLITADHVRAYEQVGVIAMPASPTAAFKFGELPDPMQMCLSDMFTISINIAGNGGITVPYGLGADFACPSRRSWWVVRSTIAGCLRSPAP